MDKKRKTIDPRQAGGTHGVAFATGMLALSLAATFCLATLPAIIAKPAQAPDRDVGLTPLPVTLSAGQSHRQLARLMARKDSFMALALGVESSPGTAYVDAAGANAGAGYCVEMRRRSHGEAQVRSELSHAGFSQRDVRNLLSRDVRRIESVKVDQAQTLRLLMITKPQYQAMARKALGAKTFDGLPTHRRDVLSYLAYNTGGPQKFVKLMDAVREGDDTAALQQMTPTVRGPDGHQAKNYRLRAWAQAAWMGPSELDLALRRPVAFEVAYANRSGQSRFILEHRAFLLAHAREMQKMQLAALGMRHTGVLAQKIRKKHTTVGFAQVGKNPPVKALAKKQRQAKP